jgi:hypothetical protein
VLHHRDVPTGHPGDRVRDAARVRDEVLLGPADAEHRCPRAEVEAVAGAVQPSFAHQRGELPGRGRLVDAQAPRHVGHGAFARAHRLHRCQSPQGRLRHTDSLDRPRRMG